MSNPDDFYEKSPQKRTLEDLKKCCCLKRGNKNVCCVNPPRLNIPLDHVILDELHLLLRVTDVLTRNILDETIEWDDEEAHKKSRKSYIYGPAFAGGSTSLLSPDGKDSGTYDWTSLMGNGKSYY